MKEIDISEYHQKLRSIKYTEDIGIRGIIDKSTYALYDYNYKKIFLDNFDSKDINILEIGPGNGHFTDWLIANGYKNITLVDIEHDNCRYLREKYENLESINVINNDAISYLKDCEMEFDVIITQHLIEHLFYPEIFKFFEYSYNILSKEGVLINATPNAQNLVYGCYMRYIDFSHRIIFTPKSYYEFSKQWFDTYFIDEKMLSPFKLLSYYFSKEVDKKLDYLRDLLNLNKYNSSSNNFANKDDKSLFVKFKLLYKHTKKYIAWKKSIKFSKKFLPDENVFSTVFIAISKPKK